MPIERTWRRLNGLALAVASLVLLTGCVAWVTHSQVHEEDNGEGIRYYRASPYLLVYSDAKGGLMWQILFLPDQTKKMTAEPFVLGGRLDFTLYFRNGILAGSSEVADTTEPPRAVIAAVQSAASLLAKALDVAAPTVPAPYLFKIVVDAGTVRFIGGQGAPDIIVTIKEPIS